MITHISLKINNMYFFTEKACSICSKELIVNDIVYSYIRCMHPVCGKCYRRSDFYEFCNTCKRRVETDVMGSFGEDKFYYTPKKREIILNLPYIKEKKIQRIV